LTRHILRRLALMVPNIVLLTFLLLAAMSSWLGSPSAMMLGRDASPEAIRESDARLGFDRPVIVQYLRWVGNAVRGDFGRSYSTQQRVVAMIAPALPVTLELSLWAVLLATVVAITLNTIVVGRRIIAPIAGALSVIGVTIPNFMWGATLIFIFSVKLRWLPTTGWVPWSSGAGPHALHLLMPVFTLSAFYQGSFGMVYRAEHRWFARQLFARVALAKGLSETRVSFRHILPNAVLPVITYAGIALGQLVGGAVVTETIFTIPGMGRLLVTAIGSYDFPVVLAVGMIVVTGVMLSSVITEIIYATLNPQIRH
jgi:peptide/nickel transport system permease protein